MGTIQFPLPWYIFANMPLMRYALPDRLGVFSYLVVGLMVSISLDEIRRRWLAATLAVFVILVLLPDLPFTSPISSKVNTPQYLLDASRRNFLRDRNTLVLPFGSRGNSMIWHAEAGYDCPLAGGWTGGTPVALGTFDVYNTLQDDGLTPLSSDSAKTLLSKLHVDTILIPSEDAAAAAQWARIVDQPIEQVDDVLLINLPRRSE